MKLGKICWICKERTATTEVNGRPACDVCASKRAKRSKRIKVTLSEKQLEFVEHLVKTGRFTTAAEVLRAGLRLLEERYMDGGL